MDIQPVEGHKFQFTRNWFKNRNLPTFREYVYPQFHDKPTVYLEIGVFEGMSMTWMLQHVLTHPDSRAVGVDPWLMTTKLDGDFMDEVRLRAHHNLRHWHTCGKGQNPKLELVRGCSAEVLRRMCSGCYAGISKNTVDLCMIDGDHNRLAAYDDAVHVYQLLKPGGVMLFDDVENDKEKDDHVKQGMMMFVNDYMCLGTRRIKHLWKHGYMEAFQKI